MVKETTKEVTKNTKFLKYLILGAVCLVLLLSLGALYLYLMQGPERVVKSFCFAMLNDPKVAYECLSADDRSVISYDKFKDETSYFSDQISKRFSYFSNEVSEAYKKNMTLKINKVAINGDTAKVFITRTMPDIEILETSLTAKYLPMALGSLFSSDHEKVSENIISAMRSDVLKELKNMPMKKKEEIFDAIKEKGVWKINLGLKKEKEISKLLDDALLCENKGEFEEAKKKYYGILKIDAGHADALRHIWELEKKQKEFENKKKAAEEKQAYMKKLILKDVKVVNYKEYSFSDPEKAFQGTITNGGDKTLTEVEITVYMYNKKGEIIAEETFHPVNTSFLLDNRKPLKPNYVRDFGWKLTKYAPSDWSGKIKVEVTDIKFE